MTGPSAPLAIVTGAARRLGRVLAQGLIDDGWQVVAHVHRDDNQVPAGAIRVVADLAQDDCADRIFAACPTPPRLLINNAARFAPDSLDRFSPTEFAAHMSVNVAAPALLTAAFAAASNDPSVDRSVINVLDAKWRAPNPDFLSYTLSKAALAQLTELSARSLADRGIRVNAVAPALMLQSPGQSAENFAAAHAFNPLGRGVDPGDVLHAVRFLRDSAVTTGEVLLLDGGQRLWGLTRDVQFLPLDRSKGSTDA
jgi:NAD(P)-dependent dehydrogenase (short-subunit alcohol dehydrogenase family)